MVMTARNVSHESRGFVFAFVTLLAATASSAGLAQQKDDKSYPNLEFNKWSGKLNVPDPVAISVDDQGRVFVTQTRRRKIQDLDIRQHREWVANDLSLTSVDAKQAFYRKVLAIGGDQKKQQKHVRDWNEDGQYDWRDLTVVSEAVYRLVDSDGDEKADEITTFAEDFKTEVTGVAAGVMAYDGTVYATVAPDVWRLFDEDSDGVADSRNVLAHGFGLHIAYGGHDMHGLTMGPDGKIYWSIGDKGISVSLPDGSEFSYPHEGGVMRCNPDGSDFEVFAHGLRNVQEVAFDQFGNMFGVDNDADQPNEKERFVYIVNQMDAGWRCYYQYRGSDYNPWTAEKLWDLPGEEHAAYIVPPIQHYIDGPAGFKFNPGTALAPGYKDYFFLTGAPNGNQHAFRVEPTGDSFLMKDEHQIGRGIAIVGLAFGPDGALYGADWDGGYPLDEKGSVIRIDVSKDMRGEARTQVQELLKQGFSDRESTELLQLLAHEDQRVRLRAQFALVDNANTLDLAALAQNRTKSQFARLHAIWALGQLGRKEDSLARDTLALLLKDSDAVLRGQAAKTFGELRAVRTEPLIPLLKDKDLHVRTLAALAVARHPSGKAVESLLELADQLKADQHYLRHGYSVALAACAEAEELAKQAESGNVLRKLCCVLALRKQGSKEVEAFLADKSNWVRTEAARAIHDGTSIPDALPALAATLLSAASLPEAFYLRAINANFRIGDAESNKRLVAALAQGDFPESGELAILRTLSEWNRPSALDLVEGIFRPELVKEAKVKARQMDLAELPEILAGLLKGKNEKTRRAALQIAQSLNLEFPADSLVRMVRDVDLDSATRVLAFNLVAERQPEVVGEAAEAGNMDLRLRALEFSLSQKSEQALAALDEILVDESVEMKKRQEVLRILSQSRATGITQISERIGRQLRDGKLDAELELDAVALLASQTRADSIKRIVAKLDADSSKDPLGRFRFSSAGGDIERGERIFRTHGQAQCSRCHRIGKKGSEIGPVLTKIAEKRDAAYLLNAVILPSKDIDQNYRSQSILLASDEVLLGRIQKAGDKKSIVANMKGELVEVLTDDIVAVKEQKTSLMPVMNEVLSPEEVRDLIAYLRTLK